jgi:hypothetical protein
VRQLTWQPGYHGLTFPADVAQALNAVADTMLPGAGDYPPASHVGVTEFIEQRMDTAQLEALTRMLADADPEDPAGIAEWVERLEADDPVGMALLRYLVYTAYYRADDVVRAINRRGFDYHAAPQPYGYTVPEDIPLPTHARGSYIPTAGVRRVEL